MCLWIQNVTVLKYSDYIYPKIITQKGKRSCIYLFIFYNSFHNILLISAYNM